MENKEGEPRKVVDYEEVDKFIKKMMDTFTSFMNNYREYERLFQEYEKQVNLVKDASKRKAWIKLTDDELQEVVADAIYKIWYGWMRYLLNETSTNSDGTATIPKWIVDRWKQQLHMEFKDLPINDKDDFLIDAKRMLELL